MTTDERLREIREREAKAAPAPWRLYDDGWDCIVDADDEEIVDTSWAAEESKAFIISARTDIPWLLSQVDSLTAERDQAREECERLRKELGIANAAIAGLECRVGAIEDINARLKGDLDMWRPLTDEEAEKALAEAEAAPLSEDRIAEMVKYATDPANRLDNSQQAQLAAANATLREQLAKAERAETEAYDCIFPYVPEAVDEHGKPLSVAGKIALLIAHCEKAEAELGKAVRYACMDGDMDVAVNGAGDALIEALQQRETAHETAERAAAESAARLKRVEDNASKTLTQHGWLGDEACVDPVFALCVMAGRIVIERDESAALVERMREVLREWVEAMDDWASYRHFTSTSKTGSERLGNAIKAARAALALTLTPSAAPPSQGDSNG